MLTAAEGLKGTFHTFPATVLGFHRMMASKGNLVTTSMTTWRQCRQKTGPSAVRPSCQSSSDAAAVLGPEDSLEATFKNETSVAVAPERCRQGGALDLVWMSTPRLIAQVVTGSRFR